MDIESAKLLGAGIAVLGVIGSGIGIGSIFSAFRKDLYSFCGTRKL